MGQAVGFKFDTEAGAFELTGIYQPVTVASPEAPAAEQVVDVTPQA